MRTIAEIRAALAAATTDEERAALVTELEQAVRAGGSEPSELEQLRSQVGAITERRSELVGQVEQITTEAVDENGEARAYTAEEAEQRGRLLAQIETLDARRTELEDQVRQGERDERERRMQEQVAQMRRELGLADLAANSQGVAVTHEHRVYERNNGVSMLKDLCFRALGSGIGPEWSRACERLARHAQENHVEALEIEEKQADSRSPQERYFLSQMIELRNDRQLERGPVGERLLSYRALSTSTTAGGEFVPPMFLTEEWIKLMRAGRVVADNCHHEDLPDGTMSINIPKVTSGTTVATQGGENTNVSNTDAVTAFVTFPVVTKAGAQTVSLQLLERSPIQFDQVILGDLARAYAQQVDKAVINGNGSGDVTGILNTSGINTVTWTQSAPTLKGLYGQIGLAKLDIAQTLFLPATHGFLTPNAWEWIGQSFDTQNRPLVVPEYSGPFNVVQVAPDAAQAEGAIGRRLSGLNVFEDANIPANLGAGTNQDVAIVSRMEENYLYESPVVTRALPQTLGQQLSVILQLYGYIAFTAARYPIANSVITGTGMASANRTFNS